MSRCSYCHPELQPCLFLILATPSMWSQLESQSFLQVQHKAFNITKTASAAKKLAFGPSCGCTCVASMIACTPEAHAQQMRSFSLKTPFVHAGELVQIGFWCLQPLLSFCSNTFSRSSDIPLRLFCGMTL